MENKATTEGQEVAIHDQAVIGSPVKQATPHPEQENVPYWLRPVLFAEERVALAAKMAELINDAGEGFKASVNQTKRAMGVYVMVVVPGVDGGIVIELPQHPNGVIVAFPKTRARRKGARLVQLTKHLTEECGCRFEVPDSYPLNGMPVQGKSGGEARIAALGAEGVRAMMESMREKRWASINDASMAMAVKFDVMGLVQSIEQTLADEGMLSYQRVLVRKRVAKMIANAVVI